VIRPYSCKVSVIIVPILIEIKIIKNIISKFSSIKILKTGDSRIPTYTYEQTNIQNITDAFL